MNQLGNIFGLSEKEAKAIIAESAYKLCCQSISDGHSNVAARLADFHYNLHGPKTVKNNEGILVLSENYSQAFEMGYYQANIFIFCFQGTMKMKRCKYVLYNTIGWI